MYIGIFNEYNVTNINLKGKKTILIRILEPTGDKKTQIKNISNYIDVLELYLPDYVKKPNLNEIDETFNELNNFILDNDFDEIIIHCSLGLSRSPAIMLCIAKILNNKVLETIIKNNYKFYNKYILDAFMKYPYIVKDNYIKDIIYEPYTISNNLDNNQNKTKMLIKILSKN